ncbi:MAG: hypothetical protein RLZZ241_1137 [Bacteroidota bacterium]|jgi:ribosomal protein L11 methyltransferase
MYYCITLTLNPPQPASEIFIAALAEIGFESFEETETGLNAYVRSEDWNPEAFKGIPYWSLPECEISYTLSEIETENWNAVWEASYQPIRLGNRCGVRASFHPEPAPPVQFDLVITPKMSFGTGHHQTTWLMLDMLLDMELSNQSVLDMGTGTGVLAILAAKKGAKPVKAIDIDPWSIENCTENINRNGNSEIEVVLGDASEISGAYDVIIANINKNVLLSDIPVFSDVLKPGGHLLLSGFFETDVADLLECSNEFALQLTDQRQRDQWTALHLIKSDK